ncbi:MAG: hypothetical protein ACQESW_08975, partial [Bacteroidota bacterium]
LSRYPSTKKKKQTYGEIRYTHKKVCSTLTGNRLKVQNIFLSRLFTLLFGNIIIGRALFTPFART